MTQKLKISFVAISIGLLSGCAPVFYHPSVADAEKQKQLQSGREIYLNKCGTCHNLHLPSEYNSEQWKANLDFMQPKAKITDDERNAVFQYLTSAPPPKSKK